MTATRTDWADPRPTHGAHTDTPTMRPPRPVPLDAAALAAWTAANQRAAREYAAHPSANTPCRRDCGCPSRTERRAA